MQVRRDWQEVFKVMKTRDLQPRFLYPANLSFRMEGQIKSFPDKKNLKEFIITKALLNENGLNAPIKRHMEAEWIAKQDAYICCLQETHFRSKGILILKVK